MWQKSSVIMGIYQKVSIITEADSNYMSFYQIKFEFYISVTDFVLGKNYDSVRYNCFINWEDIIMHYRYINFYIISLDLMGVSNVWYLI